MGFRINTNVAALNAKANADLNSKSLDASLSRLSSGLRINSAADDASGMAIADSLRSQANTLGQAISNGNDALGILQTADKAMDEQLKILDTIKTKATQFCIYIDFSIFKIFVFIKKQSVCNIEDFPHEFVPVIIVNGLKSKLLSLINLKFFMCNLCII